MKSIVFSSVIVLLAEEFYQQSRPVGLRFKSVGLCFRPVGLFVFGPSFLGLRFQHIRYQTSHTLGWFCVVLGSMFWSLQRDIGIRWSP